MGIARAERVAKVVIRKYRQLGESKWEEKVLLNRVKFAEVLLSVLKETEKVERSPQKE